MVVLQQQTKNNKRNLDWAGWLPRTIMDEILDRLVDLSDYIRFASVCVSWRSIALSDRNHRGKNNPVRHKYLDDYQIPMLMVPCWSNNGRAEFYSVTNEKILNFQLTIPYCTKRFIGSSFGWLIYAHSNFGVTLFNPFSASTIHLPADLNSDIIVKAILSADPSLHPDEFVVLLTFGDKGWLACIKPGGRLRYLNRRRHGFCDIMFSKTSRLFYALLEMGEVCTIDIDKVKADCFTPALEIGHAYGLRYIVETPSGDLLQIYRFLGESGNIIVFKFDKTSINKPDCCWSELKSLGDNALFVGEGSSMCVAASDFPGCRRGCVYYTLPYLKYLVIALDETGWAKTGIVIWVWLISRVNRFNPLTSNIQGIAMLCLMQFLADPLFGLFQHFKTVNNDTLRIYQHREIRPACLSRLWPPPVQLNVC